MFGLSYVKLAILAAVALAFIGVIGARQIAVAQRDTARALAAQLQSELREAVAVNLRNGETIRTLTVATKQAADERDAALTIAATRKTEIVTRTRTIVKEIEIAAAKGVEPPVAPSLRVALTSLRERAAAQHDH